MSHSLLEPAARLRRSGVARYPLTYPPARAPSTDWAGINTDVGSGGSVDMWVFTGDKYTPLRNYATPNVRKSKRDYSFPVGTTTVLSSTFTPLSSLVTVETTTEAAKQMEIG